MKLPEAVSCVTQGEEGDDEDRQCLCHSLPPLPHQPHHGAGQQVPGLFLITKTAAASYLVTSDFTSLHITFLRYAHVKPSLMSSDQNLSLDRHLRHNANVSAATFTRTPLPLSFSDLKQEYVKKEPFIHGIWELIRK